MAVAFAYGIYSLLFTLSVVLLVRKGIRNSRPRQILLFATCFMFATSTCLASVDTAIYIVEISVANSIRTRNGLQLSCEILFDSLFLMGDAIVLWRTWSLLSDRRALVLFPMTLWFGGLACLITLLGLAIHNGSSSDWTVGVYDTDMTNHLSMSTAALSAATNFFATLLISWKAWQHRAILRLNADPTFSLGSRVRKIMSLLIESGFIYFTLWVIAVLNFYLDWKAPVLQSILRGLYDMTIGAYPIVIIILVSLDYTFWDEYKKAETTPSTPMFPSKMGQTSTTSISSLASVKTTNKDVDMESRDE
ncbi:hypothetical protein C8J57DRAFT_1612708 [Mycena rebaudengoi]|nr:hypothetical protein C8J57DRAFT_1612708 [Mycena rebaudengoi]